jgi:TetR/AcrR family transcriptional repressor of nem operon
MSTATLTTKERILGAAEGIMLQKSFHSVGLNEILSAVKVPKGSFYHYFQSKEQFGVELLRHYVREASAHKRRLLLSSETEPNPLLRLNAYFDMSSGQMFENGCRCSCLLLKLAAEVATFSDSMREVLAEGSREWRGFFQELVREGQEKGVMRQDADPEVAGALIQDLWVGAMHRTQIERNLSPLRAASAFVCNYLAKV